MQRPTAIAIVMLCAFTSSLCAQERERVTLSIISVSVKPDSAGLPAMFLTLDPDSQKKLAAFSERHVGSHISIIVAGKEVSRPLLASPLRGVQIALTCGQDCSTLAKETDQARSITVATVP